ncbi:MAG: BMC domain-containing protein [Planctomycetota bacterium]
MPAKKTTRKTSAPTVVAYGGVEGLRPCIGLIELASIARGIETADAALKQSAVDLLFARPTSPGKYFVLLTGEVEEVQESMARGLEIAGDHLVDEAIIPAVEPSVFEALTAEDPEPELDALGIIETFSIVSAIVAADRATKAASVRPLKLALANGLGGKSYVLLEGGVADVESAVAVGSAWPRERGLLVGQVVIPRPHADLIAHLVGQDRRIALPRTLE